MLPVNIPVDSTIGWSYMARARPSATCLVDCDTPSGPGSSSSCSSLACPHAGGHAYVSTLSPPAHPHPYSLRFRLNLRYGS